MADFNNEQANNEGWGIFDCDGSENGRWQLQRCDEMGVFNSDADAWAHVVAQADAGSSYHHGALQWLQANAPQEWSLIKHTHRLNDYD